MSDLNLQPVEESGFQIDKEAFGSFLCKLRKEKGYTQKELAQRLFVSDKAVSKWERGLSMPDISLLIPLADTLEISVTELLKHRHIEQTEKLDTAQVDEIVKKTIHFSEEHTAPKLPSVKAWTAVYAASLLILFIELAALPIPAINKNQAFPFLPENLLLGTLLGAAFAVASLVTKQKLPDYYDQNKIYGKISGFFRIELPGVAFNNSNYPYILFTLRSWAAGMLTIYPILYTALSYAFGSLWSYLDELITLVFILSTLFIPLYIVGKKYEA